MVVCTCLAKAGTCSHTVMMARKRMRRPRSSSEANKPLCTRWCFASHFDSVWLQVLGMCREPFHIGTFDRIMQVRWDSGAPPPEADATWAPENLPWDAGPSLLFSVSYLKENLQPLHKLCQKFFLPCTICSDYLRSLLNL